MNVTDTTCQTKVTHMVKILPEIHNTVRFITELTTVINKSPCWASYIHSPHTSTSSSVPLLHPPICTRMLHVVCLLNYFQTQFIQVFRPSRHGTWPSHHQRFEYMFMGGTWLITYVMKVLTKKLSHSLAAAAAPPSRSHILLSMFVSECKTLSFTVAKNKHYFMYSTQFEASPVTEAWHVSRWQMK
jgi:hypothetical protein